MKFPRILLSLLLLSATSLSAASAATAPARERSQTGEANLQSSAEGGDNPQSDQTARRAEASREGGSRSPNVITLLVDDLGYRDLGCYGGPVKTPVLDKLAAGGVRFTDFHSGAPVCSPSRATFLTGRHHIRAGVYSVISEPIHRMHLLPSETTLAEVLKENGYATAHFGKWHLGMPTNKRKNPTPTEHGFDYWFGLVNGAHPNHKDPTNFLRNGKPVGPMKGYSCQIVVDEALTWLDPSTSSGQAHRDPKKPFFLNLWFNEPHAVIAAPDEIVSQYGALDDQAAIYSGTIDNTDRAIGRLLAKLEELGQLDNTIIHYSSDNGSYRQDRGGKLRGKKGAHFEGGHRVPGIFYWKDGIPGGRVEDEPAGAVDLLPTICGLAGIDPPKEKPLDGSDLTPLLTRSGTFERRQHLFWMNGSTMALRMGDHTLLVPSTARRPFDNAKANRLLQQTKSALGDDLEKELGGLDLRTRMFNGRFANPEADRLRNQFRAMFQFNEAAIPLMKKGGVDRVELYNLANDLSQETDISAEKPEIVARMKKEANRIYQSVMADGPEWATPEETAPAAPPTPPSKRNDLLTRIDKNPLPEGYHGSRHQPYVDRVMAGLKPEQRQQVGQLWKEKRRLDPDMPNPGGSFVRILTHVAGTAKNPPSGDGAKDRPARPNASDFTKEGLIGKAITPSLHHSNLPRDEVAHSWHQWRGPDATGGSPTATPPIEWSETRNVRWKTAIDGRGSSTPIIWKDQVFVLSAINTGKVDPALPKPEDQPERVFGIKHPNTEFELVVHCLDRKSGEEIWRRTAARKVPHEGHHGDNNYASASPATDGERLYCSFGSGGLFCYDLNGNKLWERDLGEVAMGASLGEGTSPVYHDGRLIIVRDNQRQSYIEVLDASSGETLWKANRNEGNTWATPRVIEHSGKTQIITPGTNRIRSYDLDTGKIIWQCGGLTNNAIPCPVVAGDYVYCMTGYKGHALLALPLSAKGDITGSDQILWQHDEGTPYVPSPLLYDGQLYFTQSNQAILTCLDAASGEKIIDRTRLPDMTNVYASPVGADGRVYLTGRNGEVLVIEHGNEFKVLALNELDDRNLTSPALAGNQIFLRGDQFLYCIEEN